MEEPSNSNPNREIILKSGVKAHKLTVEDRIKGGRVKSAKKKMQSIINGMINNPKISPEVKYRLKLLQENKFTELIKELVSFDVGLMADPKSRQRAIDTLLKLIPQKNINLNMNAEQAFSHVTIEIRSPEKNND